MSEPVFTLQLSPQAAAILKGLTQIPRRMALAIAANLNKQNELTVSHIQRTKLSARGPRTLGVRTNVLRRSIRASRATVQGNQISSSIGSNVEYLGVHEFGFNGDQQVSSFVRREKRRDVRLGSGLGNRKLVAQGVAYVRAHTRRVKLPERAPVRTGIQEEAKFYADMISEAVVESAS
jgi:phage gpG-like protein